MATTDFPAIHAAYQQYVQQLSSEPTNPTQLIKFCKKNEIAGITWSKCSKYFKSLNVSSTATHRKTTSQPKLVKKTISAPDIPINTTSSTTNHKRAQSALSPNSYKRQKQQSLKRIGPIPKIDEIFTDLKEEQTETPNHSLSNGLDAIQIGMKQNGLPISKTTPTDFQSVDIEKQTKTTKSTKKHRLLNKAWNKYKSSNWPKNRMPMSYDLKKWLIDHKFDRFAAKLYQFGMESMNDLKLLISEQICEDLCGKNGIKMTIIYRRKFIKKVLEFNKKNEQKSKKFDSMLIQSLDQNKNGKNVKFGNEMAAIYALTNKLKETTKCIQRTKKMQSAMETNTQSIKEAIRNDFDELIKILALRRKQILQSVDVTHKNGMDRLNEQRDKMNESAKSLLTAKQGISQQMNKSEQSKERRENVIDLVSVSFEECEKIVPTDYNFVKDMTIKYSKGQSAQIKNYGKLMLNDEQLV